MDERIEQLTALGLTEDEAEGLAAFLAKESDNLTVEIRPLPEPSPIEWRTQVVPLSTRSKLA